MDKIQILTHLDSNITILDFYSPDSKIRFTEHYSNWEDRINFIIASNISHGDIPLPTTEEYPGKKRCVHLP